jgi:hypothetical protein
MKIKYKIYGNKVIKEVKRGNRKEYIQMTKKEYKRVHRTETFFGWVFFLLFFIVILKLKG